MKEQIRKRNYWKTICIILMVSFVLFITWLSIPIYYEEDYDAKDYNAEDYYPQYYGEDYYGGVIDGEANPNFFYFIDSNISYSINNSSPCSGERFERIQMAFDIIQEEINGLVSFQYEDEGDIIISCYEYGISNENISGLGGPIYYEGEKSILWGEVELFEFIDEELFCESYPTIEIHEILHVFGFDHFEDKKSIMYKGEDLIVLDPFEDDQKYSCYYIDFEISECLKNIYSNGVDGSSCSGLPSL